MMKKLILVLTFLCTGGQVLAQQDMLQTHYAFNMLSVNPAYAGSRDLLSMALVHRSQWISFPGAPNSQVLTVHGPLAYNKLGIGGTLIHDQIGPTESTLMTLDLAYKLRLGPGKLAFGLKSTLRWYTARLKSGTTVNSVGDMFFQNDINSRLMPNFGAGIYYSTSSYYFGFSSPRILENQFDDIVTGEHVEKRHYYLIMGGIINIGKKNDFIFKPTSFIRYTHGAPIQFDLTAIFHYKNKYWMGPTFRFLEGFGAMAGVTVLDRLSIGYSFDWSYANITNLYNSGSHELMMRYDFVRKNKGVVSPRYF